MRIRITERNNYFATTNGITLASVKRACVLTAAACRSFSRAVTRSCASKRERDEKKAAFKLTRRNTSFLLRSNAGIPPPFITEDRSLSSLFFFFSSAFHPFSFFFLFLFRFCSSLRCTGGVPVFQASEFNAGARCIRVFLAVWVKGVRSRCRCLFEYVTRGVCVYKRCDNIPSLG